MSCFMYSMKFNIASEYIAGGVTEVEAETIHER